MKNQLALMLATFALAVSIVGCGGGSGSSSTTTGDTPPPPQTKTVVTMTGNHTFSQPSVTVAAGSIVEWTNGDTTSNHTVMSDTNQAGMNSDSQFANGLPPSATFDWTVPATATSGTKFYYHCRFHGAAGNGTSVGIGMAGVVVVQ